MIVERPALERRVIASLEAGRIPVMLGASGYGATSLLLRLGATVGRERSQYVGVGAAATTPERCLAAVVSARPAATSPDASAFQSPRTAFDALLTWFDHSASDGLFTFLLDEFLDFRTFESFPGLRNVQRDLIQHLSESPARFVLSSGFTARAHRLLRDAPARFEVIHVPPLTAQETNGMALLAEGSRPDWAAFVAPIVAALTAGRACPSALLLEGLAALGPTTDPVAALAALFAPDGQLTARCREQLEFRLQRARGYGALKAILGVLADNEPLNLTEISHQLRRTPGSTKDYLSWLEDVDLIVVRGKRYTYEDPLFRLYVRLYGNTVPPTDDDIVREISAYAKQRLPQPGMPATVLGAELAPRRAEAVLESGIIEID